MQFDHGQRDAKLGQRIKAVREDSDPYGNFDYDYDYDNDNDNDNEPQWQRE